MAIKKRPTPPKRLEALREEIRRCARCPLCQTRQNAVPGEGPRKAAILFVGEAPGKTNDETGRPFVGHGGKIFDKMLKGLSLERKELYVTNALKCKPPASTSPSAADLKACLAYLEEEIDLVKPKCIVTLGAKALETLIGKTPRLKEVHGQRLTYRGFRLLPTYHPSALRYIKGGLSVLLEDLAPLRSL